MSRSYYTLVASLPALPPHFEIDRLPISGAQLEHRLRLLHPDDLADIERMRDLLFWDRLKLEVGDATVAARYVEFRGRAVHPIVRAIAEYRMDSRTIIAALRRRRRGMDPPNAVGPWVRSIRRNWNKPDFGLGHRFSWIFPLDQALATGDIREANRIILDNAWDRWTRMAEEFFFSFEAVVLYVARWDVLDRWTSQNADLGKERLEHLLQEAFIGCEHTV